MLTSSQLPLYQATAPGHSYHFTRPQHQATVTRSARPCLHGGFHLPALPSRRNPVDGRNNTRHPRRCLRAAPSSGAAPPRQRRAELPQVVADLRQGRQCQSPSEPKLGDLCRTAHIRRAAPMVCAAIRPVARQRCGLSARLCYVVSS